MVVAVRVVVVGFEPSTPSPNEEVDIIYSYTVNISSKVDEKRLIMLRDKY